MKGENTVRNVTGLLSMLLCASVPAQNPPSVGSMPTDTVIVNSGQDYLIVPGIDDGDGGVEQSVSVAAVSSNSSVLEIEGVDYESGDRTAVIRVLEKGTKGTATVTVTVNDPDGSTEGTMQVDVTAINNPGITFEIHDIVFWQEAVPLNTSPVYSRVLQEARIRESDLDFSEIPITVNIDCVESPPCTGNDFYTQFYRGYLTVPTTGDYTFYMEGHDAKKLWLSTDDQISNAKAIVVSTKKTSLGTDVGGNQWRSAPQTLTAGKVYAIYAAHYVVHTHPSGILWEGPGITKQYIPGKHLMPNYSLEKPEAPQKLRLVAKGTDFVRLAWDPAVASSAGESYRVYLDGAENLSVDDTVVTVDGLSLNRVYSFFVVAADRIGNRSFPSNVVTETTYGTDTKAPSPPSSVTAVTVSDLAAKVQWEGATDGESEVSSYNVYVHGTNYNQAPWYEEQIVLKGLEPATNYSITVEAVDGGGNVSAQSSPLALTTLAFDPDAPELGVKKAAVSFTGEPIADACGLGINTNYYSGDVFTPNIQRLLDELRPSLLRWGALTANPLTFAGHIGTCKKVTFAKFMDVCNKYDAYCAITTGIKDGTDWRKDPQTFAHFIEYLNGPASSEYGAIRAAEGITEPLVAGSKGLLIELGNEVWGAGAHNAQIGSDYAAYGKWCREVARVMKASPYWDENKMWIVYSGRNPHPRDSYGLNFRMMLGDSGEVDMIALGGYLGGNLNYDPAIAPGRSEGEYYKNGFKRMQHNIDGLDLTIKWMREQIDQYKPSFFYETNMTTVSYNGRLGQAVTEIDYMATAIEHGSVLPAIFHLTGGQWKLVRTAENNRKLPLFVAASYYNQKCRGVALGGTLHTQGYLVDADGRVQDMDPLGYHLYANGSSYTVLLTSRDFENDYTVQLNLPEKIKAGTTARKYVLSGSDFSTIDTEIDSGEITLSDGMLVTVPKYSMVFIEFNGADLGMDLPLGHYAGPTSIRPGPAGKHAPTPSRGAGVPCEVYDLLGRRAVITAPHALRALDLPPGIYFSKQAGTVRKLKKGPGDGGMVRRGVR